MQVEWKCGSVSHALRTVWNSSSVEQSERRHGGVGDLANLCFAAGLALLVDFTIIVYYCYTSQKIIDYKRPKRGKERRKLGPHSGTWVMGSTPNASPSEHAVHIVCTSNTIVLQFVGIKKTT